MTSPNPTDAVIKLIRLSRTLNRTHLIAASLVVLLIAGGITAFAIGGGDDAPGTMDVRDSTNVTVSEDAENGTVTFTLAESMADSVILRGDDEEAELTAIGDAYTMDANQQVMILATSNGEEVLLDTFEGTTDSDNDGETDDSGDENNSTDESGQTNIEGLTPAISVGPTTPAPGQTVQFDASDSEVPEDAENVSFEWTFPDGETATGQATSRVYEERGTYSATLTITVDGESESASTKVFVGNEAPTARIIGETEGTTADTFSFDASDSIDSNGDDLTYEWEFGEEGNDTGTTGQHQFENVGEYTVRLTATDEWGASDSTTVTVTIQNRPPNADASIPNTGTTGASISFDADDASDPDGDNLSYRWDFGDGAVSQSKTADHTYYNSGSYTVRLYVTDEHGARDVYKGLISISGNSDGGATPSNTAPNADISGPSSAEAGDTLDFDASGSSDNDGDSLSYAWDFDDGTTKSGESVMHSYENSGTYDVSVTVYDDDTSDTASLTVDVSNPSPTATAAAAPTTTHVEESVAFDGSGSDPHGQQLTYEWNFGNGMTATGKDPSYAYEQVGTYDATLTVTDPDGATATDTVTITVENRAPTADATVTPSTGTVDDTYTFDASGSSDSDGQSLSYQWEFENGDTPQEASVTQTYDATGEYTATLTVTDSEGATDTTTVTATVENRPPNPDIWTDQTTVTYGDPIQFDATNSTDPEGHSLSYAWGFKGESSVDSEEAAPEYTYDESGEFTAVLTVTDSDGGTATTSVPITVENTQPEAVLNTDKSDVTTGEQIEFAASASSDADDHTLTYEWDFDDGNTSTEQVEYHSYSEAGDYTVTLTASDGDKTHTVTKTISVSPTVVVEESFEDGTLDGWTVDNGVWEATDTVEASHGDFVARSTGSSTQNVLRSDTTGIPHDANITVDAYIEDPYSTVDIDFARTDSENYYRITYIPADVPSDVNREPEFSLNALHSEEGSDDSTVDVLRSEPASTNSGTWIEFSINRTPDGETTVTAYTPATDTTETLQRTDLKHTDPGMFFLWEGGEHHTRYDNVLILDD